MMAVNHLQSDMITGDGQNMKPKDSRSAIPFTAQRVHKLIFPTYDGSEDPLPSLNRCDQFFHA